MALSPVGASSTKTESHSSNKTIKTYLINRLRIPGDVPRGESLDYLEQVDATAAPCGGKWLALGPADVVEDAWPEAVVPTDFRIAVP